MGVGFDMFSESGFDVPADSQEKGCWTTNTKVHVPFD